MPFAKAVAAVVAGVASILLAFNIDVSEELQAAIITVVTGLAVYVVPNQE